MIAHVPGLKAIYPATPCDAKGMLNLALSGTDPVIFFESQKLYGIGELFRKEDVKKHYEKRVPMKRGCYPKDAAKAIFYCVKQLYETGQAVSVTGGQIILK